MSLSRLLYLSAARLWQSLHPALQKRHKTSSITLHMWHTSSTQAQRRAVDTYRAHNPTNIPAIFIVFSLNAANYGAGRK